MPQVQSRVMSHDKDVTSTVTYTYATVIDYYLNHKQVFDYCITYEDIKEDPVSSISKLLAFLNLNPNIVQDGMEALKTHSQVSN